MLDVTRIDEYSNLTTEHCSPVQALVAANLLSDCP